MKLVIAVLFAAVCFAQPLFSVSDFSSAAKDVIKGIQSAPPLGPVNAPGVSATNKLDSKLEKKGESLLVVSASGLASVQTELSRATLRAQVQRLFTSGSSIGSTIQGALNDLEALTASVVRQLQSSGAEMIQVYDHVYTPIYSCIVDGGVNITTTALPHGSDILDALVGPACYSPDFPFVYPRCCLIGIRVSVRITFVAATANINSIIASLFVVTSPTNLVLISTVPVFRLNARESAESLAIRQAIARAFVVAASALDAVDRCVNDILLLEIDVVEVGTPANITVGRLSTTAMPGSVFTFTSRVRLVLAIDRCSVIIDKEKDKSYSSSSNNYAGVVDRFGDNRFNTGTVSSSTVGAAPGIGQGYYDAYGNWVRT